MARNQPIGPRCRKCAYALEGLVTRGLCPECNHPYDLHNAATFSLKLPFMHWRLWLPGWLLAVVGGLFAMAISVFGFQAWGAAVWLGVPFSVGAVLGYCVRIRWVLIVLLTLVSVLTLVFGAMSMNLAGVYCGLALSVVLFGPMCVGVLIGWLTRLCFRTVEYQGKSYYAALFLFISPVWAAIEGPPPAYPRERITTERVIAAPLNVVWDSMVFYEEVTHTPPLILRIGLARPLYTRGASSAVGDVKTCVYNKGRITKQVTLVERGRLLAFDVIEQHIGYERDVRLTGGSFAFAPIDEHRTKVALTTEYEPRLAPRFAWRPFERLAVHTLHGHVIEGMRRNAETSLTNGAHDSPPTREGAADAGDD